MKEWESLALHHRHIPHGRLGKRGNAGRGAEFNPKNTFGTYTFSLSSNKKKSTKGSDGILEVHGFDDTEQALQASFQMEGAVKIQGVMLLAGSRKVLQRVLAAAEAAGGNDSTSNAIDGAENQSLGSTNGGTDEEPPADAASAEFADDYDNDESSDGADRDERRVATFAKNSFRSPKFWIRWKGRAEQKPGVLTHDEDSGYVVFSKGDCRTFTGTLSSSVLGWDNKALTGQKLKSTSKPAAFTWSDFQPPK